MASTIGVIFGANFEKIVRDLLVEKGISGSSAKMLGAGEPSAKKAKYDKQKIYNEKRKEKPRKPQFSLNFQFNFGEEEEMQATSARFVRLRNMANLRSGRTNADFLQVLMDRYEGKILEKSKKKTMLLSRRTLLRPCSSFMLKGRSKQKISDVSGRPENWKDLLACRFYLPHTTLRTTSFADINR